jgi:hypothetical protein
MSGDQRSERYSLQVISEFDICEQLTVGSENKDLTTDVFSNVVNTPNRNAYYCRAIYNAGGSALTVTFKIVDDSTSYVAEIPSGQWHLVYMNIATILASGTDSGTVRLGYCKRGKIDGTATL